ncbi:MAG: rhodanese-like domain-containing protein [Thermodesulfobacteriota bacterium]
MAARKAEKLGYKNVKVFHAGTDAWKKAGHPVVSNIANIDAMEKAEGSYILIDLRAKQEIEKGHIPKAIAAPDGKVESLEKQFPAYKRAAIILYNQDGSLQSATQAYKTITGWGYKNASILDGGYAGWTKADKKVATGPAAAEIKYVKKLMPGEMEVAEFKALVAKPSKDMVLVDVRNPAEFSYCALPNASGIPLEEIEGKLGELPKDKTLVLYCSTGARSEMAYNILKKAGLKAKYVRAVVSFDDDKKHTISDD